MRVIAGSHRGRTLHAPRGQATRPTSDRVREALFSILGEIGGASVLDLFAGSGALAIEALSRGASDATLVDSSPAAIAVIRRNLEALGIDVPNATVMLVEDAERYGISQLHQLRGRIGRGEHASLCLLFGSKGSPRLKALAERSDGFELAEIDLELRGEGELVGVRQSGLAQFRVAELPRDRELQERARLRAEAIDAVDPELSDPEHALLGDALTERFGAEAGAPIRA